MKLIVLLTKSIFFFSLLTLSSCTFFNKDPLILQINSQKWTRKQFAKLLAHKILILNVQDVQNKNLIKNLKSQLITDLFIKNISQKWGKLYSISLSTQELTLFEQKIKNSYPSDIVFEQYLKRKKINKTLWKESLKNTLLSRKIMEKITAHAQAPSLKEIKKYYKNHPRLFQIKSQILIHHVFHKKKEVLLNIRKDLKKKSKLITVAGQFIKDTSEIKKPIWVQKGIFKIFDQGFLLKINEVSPILTSPYAYHIIQVLDKKPSQQMTFQKAMPQIKKKLLTDTKKALFLKWLDQQSQAVTYFKDEEAIKKIKVKLL